jgi:dsRNA-specific ribonuclease
MNLKGFTQDEMFLFNIGFNRSFAKRSLLSHAKAKLAESSLSQIAIGSIDNKMLEKDENQMANDIINYTYEVNLKIEENQENANINSNESKKTQNSQLNQDEYEYSDENQITSNFQTLKDENIDTDKTIININCFVDNNSDSELECESEAEPGLNKSKKTSKLSSDETLSLRNFIKAEKLEEFVQKNLEITPGDNKPSRIISNKVLADFVESLTGYLFNMNFHLFLKNESDNFFELPSEFLKDLGVLEGIFDLGSLEPFWLKDLENSSCKFNLQSKLNKVACLNNQKYYEFKNPNLLFQALSHPESINDKSYAYVNKSYQRLAFLGEAFVSFFVAFYVYDENPNVNECMLHKLKICGINHHIISMLAIKMNLHDLLLIR